MKNNVIFLKGDGDFPSEDSGSGGGPPMDTYFEKYLEARFAHIDESVMDIKTDIREMRNNLDLKTAEVRSEFIRQGEKIDHFKYWMLTIGVALIGLVFTVVYYHVSSMQSQMQVFADYVKAVTKPLLQTLPK